MTYKEIYRCCLQTIAPVHIGCDEVYEPTGFFLDEPGRQLTAVEPLALIRSLSDPERRRFAEICSQGTVGSILEVYKFMRGRTAPGRPVAVCEDFLKHYNQTLNMPSRDQRRVQQELNRFEIPRTAFRGIDGRAYIPGSSIKGALRTAYLNLMEAQKRLPRNNRRYRTDELQKTLLDYKTIPEDPFRLVKVSDFHPVGEVKTRIVYAVNKKKNPGPRPAQGLPLLLEVVEPGAMFLGRITVEEPGPGAKIVSPIALRNLIEGANHFYSKEKKRENEELRHIGVHVERIEPLQDGWMLRCGKHSGAESVTVEGHRRIKIKGNRGERPKILDHATTVWLASNRRRPDDNSTLRTMGWAAVVPLSGDDEEKFLQTEADYQSASPPVQIQEEVRALSERDREPLPDETPKPSEAPPATENWDLCHLNWDSGSGTLTAVYEAKKATSQDKSIIPESIQKRLFKKGKKKAVKAAVQVEPLGRAYIIVQIEPI